MLDVDTKTHVNMLNGSQNRGKTKKVSGVMEARFIIVGENSTILPHAAAIQFSPETNGGDSKSEFKQVYKSDDKLWEPSAFIT